MTITCSLNLTPFTCKTSPLLLAEPIKETMVKVEMCFLPPLHSHRCSGTKTHSPGLPKLELRLALYRRSTSLGQQRL